MKQVDPYTAFDAEVARHGLSEMRKARYRKKRKKEAFDYLDESHTYQLTEGGEPIGEPQIMTGSEAKARNDKFREVFIRQVENEMDAGIPLNAGEARLLRWRWIK